MYSKIEIALVFKNCNSEEEVLKACVQFRFLVMEGSQQHFYFLCTASLERINQLIIND